MNLRSAGAPAQQPGLTVVILNFNGREFLGECIESVLRSDYKCSEVIVVDNASSDDSLVRARQRFGDKIRFIPLSRNVGFSRGNNIGLHAANTDLVLFLNNDAFLQRDTLDLLIGAMRERPGAILQPRILLRNRPGRINSDGLALHPTGYGVLIHGGEAADSDTTTEEVFAASGACLMAQRDLLLRLGGFNEVLFAFLEDLDLGWRARLLGGKSFCVSSAAVDHQWGGAWGKLSSKFQFYNIERGRLVIILTNFSARSLVLLSPLLVVLEAMVVAHSFSNGWFRLKIRSYSDVIKLRTEIERRRETIQETRLVSDRQILMMATLRLDHPQLRNQFKLANVVLTPLTKIVLRSWS